MIDVMLFPFDGRTVAVAARHLGTLSRPTADDEVPNLFVHAGFRTADDSAARLHVTVETPGHVSVFSVSQPTALLEVAIEDLHPVPVLLRPYLPVVGLSALLIHHGVVVPVLDPTLIARRHETFRS